MNQRDRPKITTEVTAPSGGYIQMQGWSISKRGNTVDENEDAFVLDRRYLRVALSDGASHGHHPRAWARFLVSRSVQATTDDPPWRSRNAVWPDAEVLLEWLNQLVATWSRNNAVEGTLDRVEPDTSEPWFVSRLRELGSFATLLSLTFDPAPHGDEVGWRAVGIGDTCLFRLHRGVITQSMPLANSSDFQALPNLLATHASKNAGIRDWLWTGSGTVGLEDGLLLATDALAAYLCEFGGAGDRKLDSLFGSPLWEMSNTRFHAFVEAEREANRLRNDDTTLLAIWRGEPPICPETQMTLAEKGLPPLTTSAEPLAHRSESIKSSAPQASLGTLTPIVVGVVASLVAIWPAMVATQPTQFDWMKLFGVVGVTAVAWLCARGARNTSLGEIGPAENRTPLLDDVRQPAAAPSDSGEF